MPLPVFRCPDHLVFGHVKEDLFVGVEFACRQHFPRTDHGLTHCPPYSRGDNHADEVDKFGGVESVVTVRQAVATMQSSELRYEQLPHKVDQLNAYVEDILHDQNDINEHQEQFNNELALQIEVINDALDQLREKRNMPSNPIGFKMKDKR